MMRSLHHHERRCSSDKTFQSYPDRSDEINATEKLAELQRIENEADRAADVLIAEAKRSTAEYRGRTAVLQSILKSFGVGREDLCEISKSAAAEAASVRLSGRGNKLEEEIKFADNVLQAAAEARAERALAADIRRIANRNSRLAEEIESLKEGVRNQFQLDPPDSTDVKEWQAEASRYEEKVKLLRKKMDHLHVPTQSSLQKRFDECVALKADLQAAEQRLRKFNGLPPSIVEAGQMLKEARKELNELRNELKTKQAHAYGIKM